MCRPGADLNRFVYWPLCKHMVSMLGCFCHPSVMKSRLRTATTITEIATQTGTWGAICSAQVSREDHARQILHRIARRSTLRALNLQAFVLEQWGVPHCSCLQWSLSFIEFISEYAADLMQLYATFDVVQWSSNYRFESDLFLFSGELLSSLLSFSLVYKWIT